ncbi:M3 family metallopeptidase [soil metagenome]
MQPRALIALARLAEQNGDSARADALYRQAAIEVVDAVPDIVPVESKGTSMDKPNPLLGEWTLELGFPPFARLGTDDFAPAIESAQAEQIAELEAIVDDPAAPTFANTIEAFDRSGHLLNVIDLAFDAMCNSATSPALQALELAMAPKFAAHSNAIYLNAGLFARIEAVRQSGKLASLTPEQQRLLDRVHLDFVRAGAKLAAADRQRYAAIREQLASLTTQFGQNVLADETGFELELGADDLEGLPESLRATAFEAGSERGHAGRAVITLSRSLIVPFLTFSTRRELRERAWRAWTGRGESGASNDNRAVLLQILTLRHEQARLHGYATYADYALADTMAGSPAAARHLLETVWKPARARALVEAGELQAIADQQGAGITLAAWDWRFYAEQVRRTRYDLSDDEVRPYFELGRMVEAMFDCAKRLFGLEFKPRSDLQGWHADVQVSEVHDTQRGRLVGLFVQDNFARPGKRGGAWMSALRWQTRNLADGGSDLPIITNNNNFAKGAPGQPTLLGLDDVRTLFHEFGHGLHGLLSDVDYRRLSGTHVLRDFVELPSQLFEHWAAEPEVLKVHARHVVTGVAIPDELIERIAAAGRFNQGFESVEYTSSALLDLAAHSLDHHDDFDADRFEREQLAVIGMPAQIVMRHRLPHFLHLFQCDGYAAAYYVYLWAEVLDADGFQAFVEAGNPFDAAVAARLKRLIYSSGGSRDPVEAYREFRGRDAVVDPMLVDRGLIA